MKARESALRLKRFEADEKARKVADIEHMIREFEGMANDLERQIKAEEERTGVKDPAHFSYSTFAKSASQRRDNLRASADGLKLKLEAAQRERDEALEQAALADAPATRGEMRNRRRADRSSTAAWR
jgi:flagellar FliJ protein